MCWGGVEVVQEPAKQDQRGRLELFQKIRHQPTTQKLGVVRVVRVWQRTFFPERLDQVFGALIAQPAIEQSFVTKVWNRP